MFFDATEASDSTSPPIRMLRANKSDDLLPATGGKYAVQQANKANWPHKRNRKGRQQADRSREPRRKRRTSMPKLIARSRRGVAR